MTLRAAVQLLVLTLLLLLGCTAYPEQGTLGEAWTAREDVPKMAEYIEGCDRPVVGYRGELHDVVHGVKDVAFLAPDKLLMRDRSSGRVHGVFGRNVWGYDPDLKRAWVTYNDPEPFGPAGAPGLVPGRDRLRRVLDAVRARYRVTLMGAGEVAGRKAFILRLIPQPGGYSSSERLWWIDQETCLLLHDESRSPDGQVTTPREGFTVIRYEAPSADEVKMPVFPADVAVTTHRYGPLGELAATAGLKVTEPTPLPTGWWFHHAYLTVYPGQGAASMKALSWYYYAGDMTALAVLVWSPPRLQQSTTGETVLAPGITGQFYTEPFNNWQGIQWTDGSVSYRLSGPDLKQEQLAGLARSMLKPGVPAIRR